MSKFELYGWPPEVSAPQDAPRNRLTPFQQKERIAILLRHDKGASINELMALTRCTAAQARGSIRQIIYEGGNVSAEVRAEDGQQIFRLTQ